jgi:GNAT superfamily N-acetyltransferase
VADGPSESTSHKLARAQGNASADRIAFRVVAWPVLAQHKGTDRHAVAGMSAEAMAEAPRSVTIELLADHVGLIPVVGQMRWREWGHPPEPQDLDWWVEVARREAGRKRLPVTWVALDARGEALGAVGLAEYDIDERRDRSPWLIGMIVRANLRRRGVGRRLVARLEAWAREHGYRQLWVATGPAAGFYQRCGWEPVETLERATGETAEILTRRL